MAIKLVLGAFAALFGVTATAFAAPPSPLPAGWVVFDSNRCALPGATCKKSKNYEIFVQDPSGNVQAITVDATYDSWWPKLSPDRTKIMFHRTDAGLKERDSFRRTSLWVVPVNLSSSPTKLIGSALGPASPNSFSWSLQAHAEWGPSQNKIVLLAVAPSDPSLQIYVVPFTNATNTVGSPYRVSHGSGNNPRPGFNLDPAFRSDGNILFIGCDNDDADRANCDPSGGSLQELIVTPDSNVNIGEVQLTHTTDGTMNFDPYYTTDLGHIAWLSAKSCNRFGVRHSYGNGANVAEVIDDGWVNSKPSWIDSNSFYFHRWPLVATTLWGVAASNWSGGLLEPGSSLDSICSSDGPTNATPSSSVSPDPSGLSTSTVLFSSNRCLAGYCPMPANYKIYGWTPGVGVSSTPLPSGSGSGAAAGYEYYGQKISPNRKQILYFRSPRGEKGNAYNQELWVMNSDGSGATKLIDTGDAGNAFGWKTFSAANWGPGGDRIVVSAANATQFANKSAQIYRLSYNATSKSVSSPAQLSYGVGTGDRPGNNVEPSYAPNGSTIVYTGCALNAGRTACLATRSSNEVIKSSAASQSGEAIITTTTDGSGYHGPAYSPSGATIAATHDITCSATEIVQMNTSGVISTTLPNAVHFDPQWSYDGATIFFSALPNDFRSIAWKIDANLPTPGAPDDGTNLSAVTNNTPCSSEYPNAGH